MTRLRFECADRIPKMLGGYRMTHALSAAEIVQLNAGALDALRKLVTQTS